MARVIQTYDPPGAPYRPALTGAEAVAAWRSHRDRLIETIGGLDDDALARPTRCTEWDARTVIAHLADATRFLERVLEGAAAGEPTRLLEGFDPATSPSVWLADADLSNAVADFVEADRRVDKLIDGWTEDDWALPGEAPPGRVPASSTLAHILFDSWLHERDIIVPTGEELPVEAHEVGVVAGYLASMLGLVLVYTKADDTAIVWEMTDIDDTIVVSVRDRVAYAERRPVPTEAKLLTISGAAADLCDRASGRQPQNPVEGSEEALGVIDLFASVLA